MWMEAIWLQRISTYQTKTTIFGNLTWGMVKKSSSSEEQTQNLLQNPEAVIYSLHKFELPSQTNSRVLGSILDLNLKGIN